MSARGTELVAQDLYICSLYLSTLMLALNKHDDICSQGFEAGDYVYDVFAIVRVDWSQVL